MNNTDRATATASAATSGVDSAKSKVEVNDIEMSVADDGDCGGDSGAPLINAGQLAFMKKGLVCNGTHYFLEGPEDGHLLVFVHGIGLYNFCFQSLAKRFRDLGGYRTLVFDNIGLGHSYLEPDKFNAQTFSGEGHVRQIRSLLEGLELTGKRKYSFINHSMGGAITLLYANQYPGEIDSVIFMTPAGLMEKRMDLKLLQCLPVCCYPQVRSILRQEIDDRHLTYIFDDFFDKNHPNIQFTEQALLAMHDNCPLAIEAFFQAALHFPLTGLERPAAALASTDVRVMVLWAENDSTTPQDPCLSRWIDAFKGRKADFSYHSFPNLSHGFYMEKEDDVVNVIAGFLNS